MAVLNQRETGCIPILDYSILPRKGLGLACVCKVDLRVNCMNMSSYVLNTRGILFLKMIDSQEFSMSKLTTRKYRDGTRPDYLNPSPNRCLHLGAADMLRASKWAKELLDSLKAAMTGRRFHAASYLVLSIRRK